MKKVRDIKNNEEEKEKHDLERYSIDVKRRRDMKMNIIKRNCIE